MGILKKKCVTKLPLPTIDDIFHIYGPIKILTLKKAETHGPSPYAFFLRETLGVVDWRVLESKFVKNVKIMQSLHDVF